MDSEKTLRDVANELTFFVVTAAVGVALMFFYEPQDTQFGMGALVAAVALLVLLIDVRGGLAPIRIQMEVLKNLSPVPEPKELETPRPVSQRGEPKQRHLKLVVRNQ